MKNPVEADYQTINIYIPEAYFNGGSVNGYTAATAPVFLPNRIGGYMPAKAGVPGKGGHGQSKGADAMQTALARGLVVASPGARGRTSSTGKAPAAIVDLKAAVRYLKANDRAMPGDAQKNHLQRHQRGRRVVGIARRVRQSGRLRRQPESPRRG